VSEATILVSLMQTHATEWPPDPLNLHIVGPVRAVVMAIIPAVFSTAEHSLRYCKEDCQRIVLTISCWRNTLATETECRSTYQHRRLTVVPPPQPTVPINDQNIYNKPQKWLSRGLTSHSTLYRSVWERFLQVRWPNQQRQSTEGSQLATEIGFNPTRTTQPCYSIHCRQPPLG